MATDMQDEFGQELKEKNPMDSNTTADSELEEYGVWVKAGPEDLVEAESDGDEFSLQDLEVDNSMEEPVLSEEEEELLGDLEGDTFSAEEDVFPAEDVPDIEDSVTEDHSTDSAVDGLVEPDEPEDSAEKAELNIDIDSELDEIGSTEESEEKITEDLSDFEFDLEDEPVSAEAESCR